MPRLKVTVAGASSAFALTQEAMAKLKLRDGDTVLLTEAPDGGYRLTPANADFDRQISLAETIMRDERDLLRALAK